MFKKILVPLDGSSYSERVLAHLPAFVTPGGTQLLLLRVLEPFLPYTTQGYAEATEQIAAGGLRTEAEQYLSRVRGELRAMGIEAQTRLLEGDVTSAIHAVAEAEEADLIAMTTHGRSGVSRWALGSVADHVVRVVRQPVLLVRGDTPTTSEGALRRILVPLDGTVFAEQALRQVEALARKENSTVLLMRALDLVLDQELDGMMVHTDGYGALRAVRARAVESYLAQAETHLRRQGIATRSLVQDLPPADAILQTVEHEQVNLVVMSTHARWGLGRWMYGSVADAVLRGASCPVLLNHASEEPAMEAYVLG